MKFTRMGFLSNLFKKNRSDKLSKVDYWEKWEFFELLDDLHSAEKLLSEYKGGYSGNFLSAQEFHRALVDAIDDIEFGNQIDLTRFWLWFAPTCEWDDFVGKEGEELGNKIFERVDKWKQATNLDSEDIFSFGWSTLVAVSSQQKEKP